ncbi:AAA family ATPase [Microcoleus sp. AT3-A2]|uniref:AAA family ATPase n=1 Tax=Microcoleus sp. AT3-A2 TaxID=2818610 RepID=UPI002FD004CE
MHLLRVQVPDFRGLKDIDITFEKDFFPKIFPLGSQNGGGKSTLLQLIFVLLHCSFDEAKKLYLQNLLQGFKVDGGEDKRVLAIIDIWAGGKIVKLEFYCRKKFDILEDSFEEEIKSNDIIICDYLNAKQSNNNQYPNTELLCCFNNLKNDEAKLLLNKLSHKIFLAAPSTQVFLFFPQKYKKLLFRGSSKGDGGYYGILDSAKSELQGLFTYDFLAVELLIELFKAARDRDFTEAIKTGNYGNSYQALINNLNLMLSNKRINLDEDFSGVNFKLYNNGETIELYPEDLSHGELKRLSIYIWLKFRNIEDAIVLMDEVEIAFHPDWQYQIISDLKEWAPSNQYILATHSYALCEALTPAHVKEIEPKLIKQESNIRNES